MDSRRFGAQLWNRRLWSGAAGHKRERGGLQSARKHFSAILWAIIFSQNFSGKSVFLINHLQQTYLWGFEALLCSAGCHTFLPALLQQWGWQKRCPCTGDPLLTSSGSPWDVPNAWSVELWLVGRCFHVPPLVLQRALCEGEASWGCNSTNNCNCLLGENLLGARGSAEYWIKSKESTIAPEKRLTNIVCRFIFRSCGLLMHILMAILRTLHPLFL